MVLARRLLSLNRGLFWLLGFVTMVAISIFYGVMNHFSDHIPASTPDLFVFTKSSTLTIVVLTVVVAPVVETFVYQFAAIQLLSRRVSKWAYRYRVPIVALLFGLSHTYTWFYPVVAFGLGYVLNVAAVVASKRGWGSFLFPCLLHSGYNGFVTLLFILSEQLE